MDEVDRDKIQDTHCEPMVLHFQPTAKVKKSWFPNVCYHKSSIWSYVQSHYDQLFYMSARTGALRKKTWTSSCDLWRVLKNIFVNSRS